MFAKPKDFCWNSAKLKCTFMVVIVVMMMCMKHGWTHSENVITYYFALLPYYKRNCHQVKWVWSNVKKSVHRQHHVAYTHCIIQGSFRVFSCKLHYSVWLASLFQKIQKDNRTWAKVAWIIVARAAAEQQSSSIAVKQINNRSIEPYL